MEDKKFAVYQALSEEIIYRLQKANYTKEDAIYFCEMLMEDLILAKGWVE